MATTPYYQPVQGNYVQQYHPSQLDPNFMLEVGSQMQNRYDQTQALLADDTFLNFDYFPEGRPAELGRAKEQMYRDKFNKIVNDFYENKDARTATREIINLRHQINADEVLKQLAAAHEQYKMDAARIDQRTQQGGTAFMQQSRLRSDHMAYDPINPETGKPTQIPKGMAGDLLDTSELAGVLKNLMRPEQGIFLTENDEPFDITTLKMEDGTYLGVNVRTGKYERISEERIAEMFQHMMENPQVKQFEELIEYTLGEGAWEITKNSALQLALGTAYENMDFSDRMISGGSSGRGGNNEENVKLDTYVPSDYINANLTVAGSSANRAPENNKTYVQELKANQENLADPYIFGENTGPIYEIFETAFQELKSSEDYLINFKSDGTIEYSDPNDPTQLITPFTANPDGTVTPMDESFLFSPKELQDAERKFGKDAKITLQEFNDVVRRKNFAINQHNLNINRYHELRNYAILSPIIGGFSDEEFQNFQILEKFEPVTLEEVQHVKNTTPNMISDDNEYYQKIVAGLRSYALYTAKMEEGILALGEVDFEEEEWAETWNMISPDLKDLFYKNFINAAKEYGMGKSSEEDNRSAAEKIEDNYRFGQSLKFLFTAVDTYIKRDVINYIKTTETKDKEFFSGHDATFYGEKYKNRMKKVNEHMDEQIKEIYREMVSNVPVFTYAGRFQAGDVDAEFRRLGSAQGYGLNKLIRLEDAAKENIENEDTEPVNYNFFASANGVYDFKTGKDIKSEMFVPGGTTSLSESSEEDGYTQSSPRKVEYVGVAYLPDRGAGFVVKVHTKSTNTSDDNLTTRELFVQHPDAENIYIEHTAKQWWNPTTQTSYSKHFESVEGVEEEFRSVYRELTQAMQNSADNVLVNYPIPDYKDAEGNIYRLSLDIIPYENDLTRFMIRTKSWNPQKKMYEVINATDGQMLDVAQTIMRLQLYSQN